MKKYLMLSVFLFSCLTWAQTPRPPKNYRPPQVDTISRGSSFSYDISAGSGRYNDVNYTEITGGLNWQMSDWWVWRNAIFHRFGTGMSAVTGLDTSLRMGNSFLTDDRVFGLDFYVGPGYRFASEENSAVFGEAGLGFKLAGIYLGVGMKSLYYVKTRQDSTGADLPKNDNQVFIVLSGGGTL